MGATTEIAWTDATFNPWVGCTKVAPGCANCYAEADFDTRKHFAKWGPHGTRVKTSEANWKKPLKWNREAEAAGERKRVFCASLADVFEDTGIPLATGGKEPDELRACDTCGWFGTLPLIMRQLANRRNIYGCPVCDTDPDTRHATVADARKQLFAIIDATPHLDWLLLTKRPENVRRMWPDLPCGHCNGKPGEGVVVDSVGYVPWVCGECGGDGRATFRRNVWLGTSISDQPTADAAIPHLLACRDLAPVLFLSAEPLLGPVDFRHVDLGGHYSDALSGVDLSTVPPTHGRGGRCARIDWVIVGSESGHNRRPMELDWARWLVSQCRAAGVSCFVKQMEINGKVSGESGDFPADLQVREFPCPA